MKKKKVVESDLSDNNSFNDEVITSQGFTARGKPQLGGNATDALVCPPVNRHQSALPGTGQPGTGQLVTGHQSLVIQERDQAVITSHRPLSMSTRHQSTCHRATSHWSTRHQSVSPGTGQPVAGHWAPVATHQTANIGLKITDKAVLSNH